MTLETQLEAVLFFKAEPLSIKRLSAILKASESDIRNSVSALKSSLAGRGIVLMEKDNEVMLATAPETSELIEELTKEELTKDIGRAGLETLSIVLYRSPITRSGIDYIRGVNSTFILRNLLIRGLVEKIPNPKDQRSFLYRPTFELLAHLGLSRTDELPEFSSTNTAIEDFNKQFSTTDDHDGGSQSQSN